MAGLNFLDQLDDEQTQNAVRVAEAAKKAGVDPQLAVAIAFKEGGLRMNAPRGSSGEIGMMQVMPATGKGMGFSEKDLSDPKKNIDAGIKYLKQALSETDGDTKLAAAYYNGGPGALEALRSGNKPDPRVIDYIKSLNGYDTFKTPVEVGTPPPKAESPGFGLEPSPETDAQRDARIAKDIAADERRMGQLFGGGVGAGVSAGMGLKGIAGNVAKSTGQAAEQGRIAAQRAAGMLGGLPPSGMPPGAPTAPPAGGAGAPPMAGGPRQLGIPGTYPTTTGPGSAVFNYGRAYGLPEIEAGKALGTGKAEGEVWDLLTKRQQAMTDIQRRFPTETYAENPRFGGILTQQQGAGAGPRASYVQTPPAPAGAPAGVPPGAPAGAPQASGLRQLPPRQPIPMMPKQPSGLQMVTQELKSLAQPMIAGTKAVGRYAVPPLALAGAGGELADVLSETRKDEPDYIKAGLSGLSGAAGLAALYPPLTIPAGILGGGAALINYLRDQYLLGQENKNAPVPPSGGYVSP